MAIDIGKFLLRFIEEARDHIGRLGEGIAALESGVVDRETINALFRSAHTIKGGARMMKLVPIADTAHCLEDLLGALRDGGRGFDTSLAPLLYRSVDGIAGQVDKLAETLDGTSLPPADAALCDALVTAAKSGASVSVDAAPASADVVVPASADVAATTAPEVRLKTGDTVRVRLAKLDEMVKLMGEVVSSHARLRQRLADIMLIERNLAVDAVAEIELAGLRRFIQTLKDDVQAQETLMAELHDKSLVMRMLPLAIVFEPAQRMIRELARSVGKEVELTVSGAEIELDRQMIDRLSDPIIHLLRNAVDHGLEAPEQRLVSGKTARGQIRLSARQDGSSVLVEVSDDGGGIPLAAVREKAVRKGLVSAEKAAELTDREILDFIFLPGFSTSAIVTDLSGRGVGMDVVRQCILDELQGTINVETRLGLGTTFALRLPLSLAVMRVLLVQVAGLPFAFTAQHLSELVRVPVASLLKVAERDAVILRNEFVPVVELAGLLRVPAAPAQPLSEQNMGQRGLLLVVIHDRNEKLALRVDALLDECDMVIKQLPGQMRRLPLVSGMVITGKNELVSVLHAPALFELARQARERTVAPGMANNAKADRPGYEVLVVDDSLNTREIEKDVLEAHGYRVTLAEDGLDGLNKARAAAFDAILTDVEMPNMDGFSLTAKLREEEKYRHTPIIIITSREKEEDKRRGVQVGADAYIVKGGFDQNNLVATLRTLLG